MADSEPEIEGSGFAARRDAYLWGEYVAGRDNILNLPQPAPEARHALPRDIADFTGRQTELSWIEETIGAWPVVVIHDGPGVGKSALATHAAHRLRARFPKAQLYVRLGGERQPAVSAEEALRTLLTQLGVAPGAMPADIEGREALYRSRMLSGLVLLDNAMSVRQVRHLLPSDAECVTLITSRSNLAELEGARALDLGRLTETEAFDLLQRLLPPDRAGADPETVRRIAGLCDELPLALRVVASLLNSRSRQHIPLAAFADELADERSRLDLLQSQDRAVRASFDLSYATLSTPAARAFRLLGVLQVPNVSRGLASAVGASPDAIAELTDAYLLEREADGRMRFHDLMRLFAEERAIDQEPPQQRRDAVDHAYQWALSADLVGEYPVLIALVRQAAGDEYRDDKVAWLLAARLVPVFDAGTARQDWLTVAESGVKAASRLGDPEALGISLHNLSWAQRLSRQTSAALETAMDALAQARSANDEQLRAQVLVHLGTLYRELHRYPDAVRVLDEAAAVYEQLSDRHGAGLTSQVLGHVLLRSGQLHEAAGTLERAIGLLESADSEDRVTLGWAHSDLLAVRTELGEEDAALTEFTRALEIFEGIGHQQGQAWTHNRLGRLYRRYGHRQEAAHAHARALDIFRDIDDPYGTGCALIDLGIADADAESIREGIEIMERIGEQNAVAAARSALAELGEEP